MWRDADDYYFDEDGELHRKGDEAARGHIFDLGGKFQSIFGRTPIPRSTTNRDGVPMDPPLEPGGQKLAWDARGSHAYGFHNGRICKLYIRKGVDGKLAYFLTRGRVMSHKKILSIAKLMEKADKEKR